MYRNLTGEDTAPAVDKYTIDSYRRLSVCPYTYNAINPYCVSELRHDTIILISNITYFNTKHQSGWLLVIIASPNKECADYDDGLAPTTTYQRTLTEGTLTT